ncbi:hypothetical protein AN958_09745 [Leucoagaricus sp. SymC.cos]|nr:hypothetical protein AN958_09745 [Leucoagaricus sp. SymC.cos]
MSDTVYHSLYSTLSNTSSPSEKVKIHSAKEPSHDGHMSTSRSRFLLRIGAFLLLEGGFVTLAACAMTYHITLPFSSTLLTEVKAVVNMLSIAWHATTVFMVKGIALHVFSAEWMEQVHRSRQIILDRTDIVSQITAGYIDQIYHFIYPTATRSFRLSFTSIILLLAVNWLGPGTITVDLVSFPRPTTISLANLTIMGAVVEETGAVGFNPLKTYSSAINRAKLATRLEVMESLCTVFNHSRPMSLYHGHHLP